MKNNPKYSAKAQRDLEEILNYISFDLGNKKAAQNTVKRILDDVDGLADFPEMGSKLMNITRTVTDYRYIVSGNYMVFYRIYEGNIYVVRILYGRRDFMKALFGEEQEDTLSQ